MGLKIGFNNSLEWISLLAAFGGGLGVLYTFVIGKHYVIPTIILADSVLLLNLAYFGFGNKPWAKYLLFWLFALICCHSFFALFVARMPREALGELFLPIYGVVCLASGFLAFQYARVNELFRDVKLTGGN